VFSLTNTKPYGKYNKVRKFTVISWTHLVFISKQMRLISPYFYVLRRQVLVLLSCSK